jgi:4-hydroxy-2-oxoglutarate aldolase
MRSIPLGRRGTLRCISSVSRRVIGDFGISGVKYAMDLNGYFGGPARLPLLPLTGEAKAQLEQILPDIKH